MPIKYGELTIIHNAEETDIFKNISIWVGWEPCATNKSNLILLFDDGEIREVNEKLKDLMPLAGIVQEPEDPQQ